jgi:hypothetical protein
MQRLRNPHLQHALLKLRGQALPNDFLPASYEQVGLCRSRRTSVRTR